MAIFADRKNEGFTLIFAGIFDLRFYGGIGDESDLAVEPPGLLRHNRDVGETSFRRTTCSFIARICEA